MGNILNIKMSCGPQKEEGTNACYTNWCKPGECFNQARVSKPAPGFTLSGVKEYEISDYSLSSYLGKYVVLVFYPKDFTFICPTELLTYNDSKQKFDELGCEVLCISCDTVDCHWNW